ncbi:hypothetical protein, partial [Clostridioides difficile]|uniref:hypothetical protein n=1 Tax=Clostridioides difficile TaxID=1496 RepID=UPI00210C4B89
PALGPDSGAGAGFVNPGAWSGPACLDECGALFAVPARDSASAQWCRRTVRQALASLRQNQMAGGALGVH